jgi:hypothetical protein
MTGLDREKYQKFADRVADVEVAWGCLQFAFADLSVDRQHKAKLDGALDALCAAVEELKAIVLRHLGRADQ